MRVTVIPQYPEALGDGRLFEFERYDPTDAYGADRIGFAALRDELVERGHEVYTLDQYSPEDADVVMFIDMNFDYLDRLLRQENPPKLVYIMREPPSVRPYNSASQLPRYAGLFDEVLTWNPEIASSNTRISEYNIPQFLEPTTVQEPEFEEQSLLVNVSSRKYSNHPEELYSERERVINYYNEHYPDVFTLYGLYWNRRHRLEDIYHHGQFRSEWYNTYEGIVNDKAKAYANHRFALCFENMTGIEGYVTEKLFDCLRSGVVPVYWGATDIDRYVPDDVYVDYREFGTPEALDEYLRSVDEDEYRDYQNAAHDFITSQTEVLGPGQYAEAVANAVETSQNHQQTNTPRSVRREIAVRGQIERLEGRPDSLGRIERTRSLAELLWYHPSSLLANPGAVLSTVKSFVR